MDLSLGGEVALITGGSRGIGAAAVRMFVSAGCKVFFNYREARGEAEHLIAELGADRCAAARCDLSGTETSRDLVRRAVERFGRLDVLVANHGVWPPDDMPVDRLPDAQWK